MNCRTILIMSDSLYHMTMILPCQPKYVFLLQEMIWVCLEIFHHISLPHFSLLAGIWRLPQQHDSYIRGILWIWFHVHLYLLSWVQSKWYLIFHNAEEGYVSQLCALLLTLLFFAKQCETMFVFLSDARCLLPSKKRLHFVDFWWLFFDDNLVCGTQWF